MNFTSMKVGADETAVRVRDTYARRRGRGGAVRRYPIPIGAFHAAKLRRSMLFNILL